VRIETFKKLIKVRSDSRVFQKPSTQSPKSLQAMLKQRHMKKLQIFIWLILTLELFGQTIDLPPDSLIKKFHIKAITTYLNDDSVKNVLSNIWKFNDNGELVSNQLFVSEDTTLDIELFFYKNNLLSAHWHIGTWTKYDTVKTIYHYDNQKRIIKETTVAKFNPFNNKSEGFMNSVTYTYLNDSIVMKKYEGNALTSRGSGIDSIIYNKDNTLRLLFNKENDLKILYSYNDEKQLLSEVQTSTSTPDLVFQYNKYVYEKDRLIKEIIGHSIDGKKEKISEQVYYYINDKNGLLMKIERQWTFDTYEYEYYK